MDMEDVWLESMGVPANGPISQQEEYEHWVLPSCDTCKNLEYCQPVPNLTIAEDCNEYQETEQS